MTSVVLDTNELQQDWLCTSLRYQVIRHAEFHPPMQFLVPALVVEELVANHARAVDEALTRHADTQRRLRRLGLDAVCSSSGFDYRALLLSRFDELLGITVLDWPDTPHDWLVARSTARTPPFDAKGGGYRDSLIWWDVLALARRGKDVALVTHDSVFGRDGVLAEALRAELQALPGDVELVSDLGQWLLGRLPFQTEGLHDAVDVSRDREFEQWYLQSDFQSDLEPTVASLGLPGLPVAVEVDSCEWDGLLGRAGVRQAADGLLVVEYDIGQTVEFVATYPETDDVANLGDVLPGRRFGCVDVRGEVEMIVRVGVMYDTDYWGVEDLSWRRADGRGPGVEPPPPGPPQEGLF